MRQFVTQDLSRLPRIGACPPALHDEALLVGEGHCGPPLRSRRANPLAEGPLVGGDGNEHPGAWDREAGEPVLPLCGVQQ